MNHWSRAAGLSPSASSPAPEGLTRAPCARPSEFRLISTPNNTQLRANRRVMRNLGMKTQPRKVDGGELSLSMRGRFGRVNLTSESPHPDSTLYCRPLSGLAGAPQLSIPVLYYDALCTAGSEPGIFPRRPSLRVIGHW